MVAGGTPPLTYKWLKDGTEITGAKGPSYTLAHATDATVADYTVSVTNAYGTTPGGTSHVVVEDAPKVTVQPLSLTKPTNGTAQFGVTATGSPSFRYQWQKNNVNLPGETGATLMLNALALKDAASYRVVITNDVGTATSAAAKLSVLIPPHMSKDPVAQGVFEYDSVTFTGAATGSPAMTYQWQKDGVNIPGAKSTTLTLTGLRRAHGNIASQEGDYTLVATNPVGSATSAAAHLTIDQIPPPDISFLSPYRAKIGHQVLVRGSNFRWTNKVTFNGVPATFIKVNTSEMILNVPKGATTGPIVVQTAGGTISTTDCVAPTKLPKPLAFADFTITPASGPSENDDFINARFLTAGYYFLVGDSVTHATFESGEPAYSTYGVKQTIWYRWRPPATGFYRIDTG